MKYNRLGKTGLRVSEICLGAMTFGANGWNIGELDQAGADAMVQRALSAGVNFFDTADIYAYGQSEEILGRALKNAGVRRDASIIATKVLLPMSQEAWDGRGDKTDLETLIYVIPGQSLLGLTPNPGSGIPDQ